MISYINDTSRSFRGSRTLRKSVSDRAFAFQLLVPLFDCVASEIKWMCPSLTTVSLSRANMSEDQWLRRALEKNHLSAKRHFHKFRRIFYFGTGN